jgi:hypothetical protein
MIDPSKLIVPKFTRGQLNCDNKRNHKRCYVCQELKHESEYSGNRTRSDGLQTYCKECGKAKQSQWYYQRVHKITIEERDSYLAKQDFKCGICGQTIAFRLKNGAGTNIGNEAVLDHCHTSKKIRGVLCGFCNTGLGAFKDNSFSLENAIQYLLNSVED